MFALSSYHSDHQVTIIFNVCCTFFEKIGKILRGLTPNAKINMESLFLDLKVAQCGWFVVLHALKHDLQRGTVTNNVAAAVKEAKQGLLDFRMKDAIVHVGLGNVCFLPFFSSKRVVVWDLLMVVLP